MTFKFLQTWTNKKLYPPWLLDSLDRVTPGLGTTNLLLLLLLILLLLRTVTDLPTSFATGHQTRVHLLTAPSVPPVSAEGHLFRH